MLCVFDGTLPRLGRGVAVEPYILFDLSSFCSFAFIDLTDDSFFFRFSKVSQRGGVACSFISVWEKG